MGVGGLSLEMLWGRFKNILRIMPAKFLRIKKAEKEMHYWEECYDNTISLSLLEQDLQQTEHGKR